MARSDGLVRREPAPRLRAGRRGAQPYGIPWQIVSPSDPLIGVQFQYASESDAGPYPLMASTPIETGSDRHGTSDVRWTGDQVNELKQIPARMFEAVNESCLKVSSGSGRAYQPGHPRVQRPLHLTRATHLRLLRSGRSTTDLQQTAGERGWVVNAQQSPETGRARYAGQ